MGLAILARINHQISAGLNDLKKIFGKEEPVSIARYLDERLILFLNVGSRDEALDQLIDLLYNAGKLHSREEFRAAILEREKIVSTGIGLGVAIPHAKLEGYSDFFIAVGIQPKEGVEWNALDGSPVRLVFMIGGPDYKQTEYLRILSQLTIAIKGEEKRKKLLKARRAAEVIELFAGL